MTISFKGALVGAGLASAMAFSGAHASQEWPYSFLYVGGEVAYYDIQKGKREEGDVHNFVRPAIQLGWRINEHFSVQLQHGQMNTEARNFPPNINEDIRHRQTSIVGRLHWNEIDLASFHPYLGLGYAYHELDPRADEVSLTKENMVSIEVGVQRLLSENFMLDAGYRTLVETGDSFVDRVPYLALNYLFNQRYDTIPFEEEPVWVDSDGDGVPDHLDKCPNTPAGAKVDEHGCHLTLTETVNITLHIEFEFDSTDVPSEFRPKIAEVAQVLTEYPDSRVLLEGHTDNIGRASYNQNLSLSRADAVKRVLVSDFNINADRIHTSGMGLTQPIADNSTDEGRARNRRVEAIVSGEREVIQRR